MVALAPVFTPTAVHLAWSRMRFVNAVSLPMGIALQPDLGPPILV